MNERTSTTWNILVVDFAFITIIWLLSLWVVNPIGNFPLDDDWSYGSTVKHFLETGHYEATGWESMTLIVNVLWGSAFCSMLGFSFTVLRLSTLVASWLGIFGVYWLLRELRVSRWVSLLVTMVFAFDPIYYVLSNTFMTDVLFTGLAVFAGIFLLKDIKTGSNISLALGTTFAVAAVLSRQVGLAVPLAFAMVSILQNGWKPRAILRGAVPLVLCVAALVGFQYWLAMNARTPALYNFKNVLLVLAFLHPVKLVGVFAHSSYLCVMYLGLFLAPVLVFTLPQSAFLNRQKWFTLGVLMVGLVGLTFFNGWYGKGFTMPLATNILNKSGLGPLTLHDAYQVNTTPMLANYFWAAVTFMGVLGAAILIYRIVVMSAEWSRKFFPFTLERDEAGVLFLLLTALVYLLPFFVNGFFDRYLFPAVPFLAAALVAKKSKAATESPPDGCGPWVFVSVLLLVGYVVFSICGTRDYLEWNRTRWKALNDLTQNDRVQPSLIDGGFEFNGFYLYDPNYQADAKKSFWWVDDDLYLVNFHPATNYTVFRTYPFKHWMPSYLGDIYVLKRNPD
jgi:hypothetical protein